MYQPSLVIVTKKSGRSRAALSATSGSVSSKQIKRREVQRRVFHREIFRARPRREIHADADQFAQPGKRVAEGQKFAEDDQPGLAVIFVLVAARQ